MVCHLFQNYYASAAVSRNLSGTLVGTGDVSAAVSMNLHVTSVVSTSVSTNLAVPSVD